MKWEKKYFSRGVYFQKQTMPIFVKISALECYFKNVYYKTNVKQEDFKRKVGDYSGLHTPKKEDDSL